MQAPIKRLINTYTKTNKEVFDMSNSQSNSTTGASTVWQIVGRLITAAIVLAITAFFTPNFSINNISLFIKIIVFFS